MRLKINGPDFQLLHGRTIAASAQLRCYRGVWTLRKCQVAVQYRGQRLQRRLIRARVAAARRLGADIVTVWVDPLNSHSLNNLIAERFRFMHRRPRVFGGVEHIGLHCQLG